MSRERSTLEVRIRELERHRILNGSELKAIASATANMMNGLLLANQAFDLFTSSGLSACGCSGLPTVLNGSWTYTRCDTGVSFTQTFVLNWTGIFWNSAFIPSPGIWDVTTSSCDVSGASIHMNLVCSSGVWTPHVDYRNAGGHTTGNTITPTSVVCSPFAIGLAITSGDVHLRGSGIITP
jgi:hypothetical protein